MDNQAYHDVLKTSSKILFITVFFSITCYISKYIENENDDKEEKDKKNKKNKKDKKDKIKEILIKKFAKMSFRTDNRMITNPYDIVFSECVNNCNNCCSEQLFLNGLENEGYPSLLEYVGSKSLKFALHGTQSSNINHILCDGFDIQKRKRGIYGEGEYFSDSVDVALSYGDCVVVVVFIDNNFVREKFR